MRYLPLNIKTFRFIFFLACVSLTLAASAQQLKVVDRYAAYKQAVGADSLQGMVELKDFLPAIVYDLQYATKENFTGKKLYKAGNKTFVRLAVARALQKVSAELLKAGYGLKIWDAYRPYAVTKKMWELIGDERYVANPAKGSGHNRGLAVDLTLTQNGNDVDMGTVFDNFTDSAHHNFKNLSDSVSKNRVLLRTTMEKYGFNALETEWWHYSFPNDGRYDVLDIPFRKLGH
ncbi:MAG TPA: M15 family metallopeptidase [Flavisolibacter sp.]|jgi:D-alanyl-D-alanine dipeptidase|nr:M15 family metallopeptidase [Flavisolibacter sp.]